VDNDEVVIGRPSDDGSDVDNDEVIFGRMMDGDI